MVATNRYARVLLEGGPVFVEAEPGGSVFILDAAPWAGGQRGAPLPAAPGGSEAPFLTPIVPSKILGIGRNYVDHAKELGNPLPKEPMAFFKPPSSLLGPGGTVRLPPESGRVDFEAELLVVVGSTLRRATQDQASEAVFGLGVACDVTARDLQKTDRHWTRAKGFDTFCPVGPWITRGIAPAPLRVELWQNNVQRQDGSTRDMVFGVPALLAHASQSMTLEPGDVVLTGTPAGVGPMAAGDAIRVAIESLGSLEFSVENETGNPAPGTA